MNGVDMRKAVSILGIRGVPAKHGGFETFAERLALYLVDRGWRVTVYCQLDGSGSAFEDEWQGVVRVNIPVRAPGAMGTVVFDFLSTIRVVMRRERNLLTLGYNTAIFGLLPWLLRYRNSINMDGLEWKRDKWGRFARSWLWLNERFGCWLGSQLIADHPEIEAHLRTRVDGGKIRMIPYGAPRIDSGDVGVLARHGLQPDRYFLVIARPEPENSVLEMVRAFSAKARGFKLVVLGNYVPERNDYHARVMAAASDEVAFVGAIYDANEVSSLRFHARAYLHGHRVGGTNPSLVEALGAGNAVIAHDNPFNRWVAGDAGQYFRDESDCARLIDEMAGDVAPVRQLRDAAVARHAAEFTWDVILASYERALSA